MYTRLALIFCAGLYLAKLGAVRAQDDPQSRLDATLDNHPAFDTQHPQRALTEKVDGQHGKTTTETLPPLSRTPDVKSEKQKAEAAERAKLRKQRDNFLKARVEELKADLEKPATQKMAGEGAEKISRTEPKQRALEEWNNSPKGKKLQQLDANQPTLPPLSR